MLKTLVNSSVTGIAEDIVVVAIQLLIDLSHVRSIGRRAREVMH